MSDRVRNDRETLLQPAALATVIVFGIALGLIIVHFRSGASESQVPVRRSPGSARWTQYDTAAYVVSTLNLLSRRSPHDLATRLHRRGIMAFAVRADTRRGDLYFVQLMRAHHHIGGVLAYRYGWRTPRAVTRLPAILPAPPAPLNLVREYWTTRLTPLETFRSTFPTYALRGAHRSSTA